MFDYKFDYLNAGGSKLIQGFHYAVGDTPQPIESIHEVILGNWPFRSFRVGIKTKVAHGLNVGDVVILKIVNADSETTKQLLNNNMWKVAHVFSDIIFTISTDWVNGMMVINGTWQLASSGCLLGNVKDSTGVCVPEATSCPTGKYLQDGLCFYCPTGQHVENNVCIPNTIECLPGKHEENGVCVNDVIPCGAGFHKDTAGNCVPDALTCPTGQTLTNGVCVKEAGLKLPTWAIYAGLAVVAGLLVWVAIKGIKPKQDV